MSGKRVLDLGCGLGVPGCVAGLLGAQVTFADRTADALAFATWNAMQLSGRKHEQQQIDWSRQTVAGVFDMILLADVSYHVMHHVPLLEHLSRCLIPGGVVLHADPFRDASTRFLAELSTRLGTKEADVVVREGADSKLVRVVVASSCPGALRDWSRSFGGSRREG